MRIENLRSEKSTDRARVAATVTWEDCDRPAYDLYFETDRAFEKDLTCNPHAFLVGCIIPAMHYREKRVFIGEKICPELREGLITAMSWLRQWYYRAERELVRIEAKTKSKMSDSRKKDRAGLFFSGGIDSFAVLRENRLNFPLQHPRSIKDGLLVYGLEQDDPELFEHVVDSLSEIVQDAGITLIPVYTNLYLNYRQEDAAQQFSFWAHEFGGAALAAIGHAFALRLTVVSIAASRDASNLQPWGTHPLLDPNYSSSDLRIIHDGLIMSRLERTKLVADWDPALQHIRVCNKYKQYQAGMLNCGECEKCLRTMLTLLALGVLDRTRAFPRKDISAELILEKVKMPDKKVYLKTVYRELIDALAEKGRYDLVEAIKQKLNCKKSSTWKEKILQIDRKYLQGNLARFKRTLSHK